MSPSYDRLHLPGDGSEWGRPESRLSREAARAAVERRLQPLLGSELPTGLDLRRLSRYLTSRRYGAGDLIVRRGARAGFLGVVAAGRLATEGHPSAPSSRSQLAPESVFGEAMLLHGQPSDRTLRALTDAQVYFLRRADLLALMEQRPAEPPLVKKRRRPDPWLMWTAAALVLLLAVAGLRFGLGFRLPLPELSGVEVAPRPTEPLSVPPEPVAIRIVEPSAGAVIERSVPVTVRASLGDPQFGEAELVVSGMAQGLQTRPEGAPNPWLPEWSWAAQDEGAYQLIVEARDATGAARQSPSVTVTLVPAGELLFASNRDGAQAIYIMRLDGQDARRLTPGPAASQQPAWGRHGRLAYVEVAPSGQTDIWITDLSSATARFAAGRDPAWSADGTRLAYAAGSEGTSQVFVTTGQTSHQVTSERVYAGQPAWAPDGLRLAYAAERNGNMDIWLTSLNRTDAVRLTDDPATDWAPAWSPDGQRLAFVSDRNGMYQIYVMRADGSQVTQVTHFERGAESPAWSPDGRWIAFVTYTGEGAGVDAREIYLMRPDGRDLARLTTNAYDDSQPAWGAASARP